MKYILPLLILLCISCKQEPKIEIYLLKERVEFYEGVPILEVEKFKDDKQHIINEYLHKSRWDTIKDDFIFMGKFNVMPKDLQNEPFIRDNEIVSLNLKEDFLNLDATAVKKFTMLDNDMRYGTQFVIVVDDKALLTGYFLNYFSSYWCHTFHILYTSSPDNTNKNSSFEIFEGPIKYTCGINKPDYPKELIEAFRSSGRLIE